MRLLYPKSGVSSSQSFESTILLAATLSLAMFGLCSTAAKAADTTISGQIWTGERTTPPRATVQIQVKGKKVCESCEVTTETGKYKLSVNLDPGSYTLKAYDSHGSYLEATKFCVMKGGSRDVRKTKNCVLYAGQNDDIDFTLEKPPGRGDSRGIIRNREGGRLASVEVIFSLRDCDACIVRNVKTDANGAFTAPGLAARIYNRVIVSEGISSIPEEIEVRPEDQISELTINRDGTYLTVSERPFRDPAYRPMEMVAVYLGLSIQGRITDANGAVIPNVPVTATREGGRSQTSTSDDNGVFRVFNLEPGTYTVRTAPAHGFAESELRNIDVTMSTAARVDILVAPEAVTAEQITITSDSLDSVILNPTDTSLKSRVFEELPTLRTIAGLSTMLSTVTDSGVRDATGRQRDPSVAGSSGPENNYILDGISIRDPDSGGSQANPPVQFVEEIQVKTGAFSAEFGKTTGGVFNIITKSGTNEFHGDVFGDAVPRTFNRAVRNFPFTGSSWNDFADFDFGVDLGGPIVKDRAWFFGAFNPQRRSNYYLTQTLREARDNKATIPYYSGKLSWAVDGNNNLTVTTFGDFTSIEGFLGTGTLTNGSGFGSDANAFHGRQETGGHNYAFVLSSTIRPKFLAEFSGGFGSQRRNTIPISNSEPLIVDNFAVLRAGQVLPVVQTGINFGNETGLIDFVDGRGGVLARNFLRGPGFGLFTEQQRKRYQLNARFQTIIGNDTLRWGFEWLRNTYHTNTRSSGSSITYGNPLNLPFVNGVDINQIQGARIYNNFLVCAVRGAVINCPSAAAVARAQSIPAATLAALGLTLNPLASSISIAEMLNSPFLVRSTTRVRDFQLVAQAHTDVESFYLQQDINLPKDLTFNVGARWDFQQGHSRKGGATIALNNLWYNLAPRLGARWDFTGQGKGSLYANYGVFVEVPIPLELVHRAAGDQIDKNFSVNQYGAPATATIVPGIGSGGINVGSVPARVDRGLRPTSIGEATAGIEFQLGTNFVIGARGIYRYLRHLIEDGSFDEGVSFFIFNPGQNEFGTSERLACEGDRVSGRPPRCLGPARRYYRALEITGAKRLSNRTQFTASYVFSSLIGNYEGMSRTENGQADPLAPSLFDLPALPDVSYGRLSNDRPHEFKFSGSVDTRFGLLLSGIFHARSGTPINMLIPHPLYGNNAGFAIQRGTAVVPTGPASEPGFPAVVDSTGSTRTPAIVNLDLGAHYTIHLGEERWLRFTGDWFNVFNDQRALILDQTFSINSGLNAIPPVKNPFWGTAMFTQRPSSFRLGIKFTF